MRLGLSHPGKGEIQHGWWNTTPVSRHHLVPSTAPHYQSTDMELAKVTNEPLTANPRSHFSHCILPDLSLALTLAITLDPALLHYPHTTVFQLKPLCVQPDARDPSDSTCPKDFIILSKTPTPAPPWWPHHLRRHGELIIYLSP